LTKIDMVAEAMRTLGSTTPAELSAYVAAKHGVEIEPRMMPIFRASVEQREALERARSEAKELIARAAVEAG
jgi:DNA-binding ferritin-like protein